MAERNQKVLDRVQQELEKDASISSRQLHEIAQGVDKSIGSLSLRQFNAGYVLPHKRKKGGRKRTGATRGRKVAGRRTAGKATATPRGAKRSTGSSSGDRQRDGVRQALLQLARDVASADDGAKLVDVVGNLDPYVDRVLKAAR
jgi:hypothetical protein